MTRHPVSATTPTNICVIQDVPILCSHLFFVLFALLLMSTSSTSQQRDLMARRQGPRGAYAAATRYTTRTTTTTTTTSTASPPVSFYEGCDYTARYCMKAYDTGRVCGRTLYWLYHDFLNYCQLQYVNCMERYEIWEVAHMGECFNNTLETEYFYYPFYFDSFLEDYYVTPDTI